MSFATTPRHNLFLVLTSAASALFVYLWYRKKKIDSGGASDKSMGQLNVEIIIKSNCDKQKTYIKSDAKSVNTVKEELGEKVQEFLVAKAVDCCPPKIDDDGHVSPVDEPDTSVCIASDMPECTADGAISELPNKMEHDNTSALCIECEPKDTSTDQFITENNTHTSSSMLNDENSSGSSNVCEESHCQTSENDSYTKGSSLPDSGMPVENCNDLSVVSIAAMNDGNDEHDEKFATNCQNCDNIPHDSAQTQCTVTNKQISSTHETSETTTSLLTPCGSPVLSILSDGVSEESNDSGNGDSETLSPAPLSINRYTVYEFEIPQSLVGRLIGRRGVFVNSIKDKTNANILVKAHPFNAQLCLCQVEGYAGEIDNALKIIREKFPLPKFADITLQQFTMNTPLVRVPVVSGNLYLKLIEGINNDTIISSIVDPSHIFVQQPTHPTFPHLKVLSECMNMCYNDPKNAPMLVNPIPENTICVAYTAESWYRAMVLSMDTDSDVAHIKFLDYGGYGYFKRDQLRQIRGDFMMLPFQAAECILCNIKPVEDKKTWPEAAYTYLADLTKNNLLYVQIVDYSVDAIPLVHCYLMRPPNEAIFVNRELVNQGFADWVD